jgi:hypothetical protein
LRGLRSSWRWRFKSRSSGLWRRVVLYNTSVFEVHAAFIFMAARTSETSVSYHNNTRRYKPENLDLQLIVENEKLVINK